MLKLLLLLGLTFPISTTPAETVHQQEYLAEAPEAPVLSKRAIEYLITTKATQNDLSPTQVLRQARCESNLDANAKNPTSSASGLFQFITGTWTEGIKRRGLDWTWEDVFDPEKNIDMAIWFMSQGESWRWVCQ